MVRPSGLRYPGNWTLRRTRLAIQRAVQAELMDFMWQHKIRRESGREVQHQKRREDHIQWNKINFGVLFLVHAIPKKDLSCGQCNQRNLNILICFSYTSFNFIGFIVSILLLLFSFCCQPLHDEQNGKVSSNQRRALTHVTPAPSSVNRPQPLL